MAEQQLIGALEAGGTKMVCATGYADGTVLEREQIATTTPQETVEAVNAWFADKGRVGLRCSFFGPASARSNVSSNSSLYKSQTLLSTIFGRSASSCQSLCGGKGNNFPPPAGAALCSLFPV